MNAWLRYILLAALTLFLLFILVSVVIISWPSSIGGSQGPRREESPRPTLHVDSSSFTTRASFSCGRRSAMRKVVHSTSWLRTILGDGTRDLSPNTGPLINAVQPVLAA